MLTNAPFSICRPVIRTPLVSLVRADFRFSSVTSGNRLFFLLFPFGFISNRNNPSGRKTQLVYTKNRNNKRNPRTFLLFAFCTTLYILLRKRERERERMHFRSDQNFQSRVQNASTRNAGHTRVISAQNVACNLFRRRFETDIETGAATMTRSVSFF